MLDAFIRCFPDRAITVLSETSCRHLERRERSLELCLNKGSLSTFEMT